MEDTDYYTAVPLPMLKDIEHLVDVRKKASPDGRIESDKDFEILVNVYGVWRKYFPEDYRSFIKSAEQIRNDVTMQGTKGIVKGEGEARMQHQLEIPEKLHQMIVIIFPQHKYDKAFVKKFVQYLPEFRVSDAKF